MYVQRKINRLISLSHRVTLIIQTNAEEKEPTCRVVIKKVALDLEKPAC